MESINLREGWRTEQWGSERDKGRFVALCYERCGAVTLDFEMRVFRAGWSSYGPSHQPDGLTGRGWKQRLADAAMHWLEDIFIPRQEQNNPQPEGE